MGKKIDYFALFTNIKYTKKPSNEPLLDEFEVDFVYKNHNMGYFFFPPKSENKTEEDIKKEFEELIRNGKLKKYADNYYGHKKILVPLISLLIAGAIAGASVGTYFALKGNAEPTIKTYNFDFDGGTTCQIDGSYTKHVADVEEGTVLNYTIQIVEPTIHHPLTDVKVTIDDKAVTKGTDYTFDGNTGAFSITMKGNVKVVANAELMTFNVTFHHIPDPESGEKTVETIIPVQAGRLVAEDKHDFTGHHLVGYYCDDKFGEPFKFEDVILKNTDVYVEYLLNEYTVTWSDWDGEELKDPEKCKYGKVPTPPADPVREPDEHNTYEFCGWSPAVGEIKEDTNFVAQYTPTEKVYTLTLDLNGGSWIGSEQKPEGGYDTKFKDLVDSTIKESINSPEGKYLAGWTYTKDDETTLVNDEDEVFHHAIQPAQSVTVYACYKYIDYHLTASIENCQVNGEDEYSTTFNFGDTKPDPLTITANDGYSVPKIISTDDLESSEYTYTPSAQGNSATLTFNIDKMPNHGIAFTGEGDKHYHIIYDTTCKNVTISGVEDFYLEGGSATITVKTDPDLYSVPSDVKFTDDEGKEFTNFSYTITDDTDTQKSSRTEATITITDAFPASNLYLSMEARERFFIDYSFTNASPNPTTPKPYYHHNDSPVTISFGSITSGDPLYSVPGSVTATNTTSSYNVVDDDKAVLTISKFTGEAGATSTITASGRQRCFITEYKGNGYERTPDKNYYHAGESASIGLKADDGWELPENSSTNYIVKVNGTEIDSAATLDDNTHKTGKLTFKMPDDPTKVGPISVEVKTIKQYFLNTDGITNLDSSEIDKTTPHHVNDEVTFTIKKTTINDVTYSTPIDSSKYTFTNAEFVEFTSSSDDVVTIKVKVNGTTEIADHSIGISVAGITRHLITTTLTNLDASGKADYYHEGAAVSITLEPAAGYGVPKAITLDPTDSLTYTPSTDRESATLTGTMPAQGITVTAVASKQFAVNLSGNNVTWTRVEPTIYDSDEIYYEGDTVKLKVSAGDSYILPTALPEGTVKTVTSQTSVATSNYELNTSHSEATFTFTMPSDSVNVSLNATQLTITDDSKNCSLTFNKIHYRPGDTITATVMPDDGYNIDGLDLTATVTDGSTSYTATYDKDNHQFTIENAPNENLTISVKIYNVTFNAMGGKWNDGDVIKTTTYNNGATLVTPDNPSREATVTTSYAFNGWNATPSATVTADLTYYAQWTSTPVTYDITWKYYDATGQLVTDTETSKDQQYGATLTQPDVPSSYQSGIYVYTFVGWDKPVRLVDGDETYVAQYTQGYQQYTVKWLDGDGATVLKTQTYDYGATPVVPSDITTPSLIKDDHAFTWTGEWEGIAPLIGSLQTVEITPIFDENVYYQFTGTDCYVGDSQAFVDIHTFGDTNVTYTVTAENGFYFDADTTKSEYYSIQFDGVTPSADKVTWTVSADGLTLTVKINEAMKYNVKLNVKAVAII